MNTSDTRVELSWDLEHSAALTGRQRALARRRLGDSLRGVLTVVASERRSQLRNREAAMERLGELGRPRGDATAATAPLMKPTKGSRERRLDAKRRQSEHEAPAPTSGRLSRGAASNPSRSGSG